MSRLLISALLSLSCFILGAQNSIFPDLPYTNLQLVAAEGDHIFSIGSCNLGVYSLDAGANWNYLDIPDELFRALEILPGSQGKEALVLSQDALYIWNIETEDFTAVDVSDVDQFGSFIRLEIAGNDIYVISVGAVVKADVTDFEWEKIGDVLYDEDYFITTSSITEDYIYIGSNKGHIFTTDLTDGTYTEIHNFGNRLSALEMFDNGVGYATVQGSSGPQKSTNGGTSWSVLSEFVENAQMYAGDPNTVLTINTNRYSYSNDGGVTTTEISTDQDENVDLMASANFSSTGQLYMVGNSASIIKSENGGMDYINLNPYNRSALRTIEVNENGYGVAVGEIAILETTDNGENWSYIDPDLLGVAPLYMESAIILDDNKFMVGYEGGHAIIENGAVTSQKELTQNGLHYEKEKGFILGITAIGSNYVINKSTDEGANWENKYFYTDYINQIKSTAGGKYYIPTSNGGYLISENEGEDWEEVTLPEEGFLSTMALLDDGTSLFALDGKLYESSDAGASISQIATGFIRTIQFIAADHFVYTQRSGQNTSVREKLPEETDINIVATYCSETYGSYLQDDHLWFALKGGHINRYDLGPQDSTSFVQTITVSALPITPNPVIQGGTIQLPISASNQKAHLRIFDYLGQQIYEDKNLVNTTLGIDPQVFTAGTYFLRIETPEEIAQGKLIVLN